MNPDVVIPDPDALLTRRERAARRLVGLSAWAAVIVAVVVWLLGPVQYLLVHPYIWRGRGFLGLMVFVVAVGAVGLVIAACDVWRHRRSQPDRVGRDLAHIGFFAVVAGAPALTWWPFWLRAVAGGVDLEGWEWFAWLITAIASVPAIPFVFAIVAWARWRALPHAAGEDVSVVAGPRRRETVLACIAVCTLGVALAWPGGPRPSGTDVEIEGIHVDEIIRGWHTGDLTSALRLRGPGNSAVKAVGAQLPADVGLRAFLARSWGVMFAWGNEMAAGLGQIQMGAVEPDAIVYLLGTFGPDALPFAGRVADEALGGTVEPHTSAGALFAIGSGSLPHLLRMLEDEKACGAALAALESLGASGVRVSPPDLAAIQRRLAHPDANVRVQAARAYCVQSTTEAHRTVAVAVLREVLRGSNPAAARVSAAACAHLGEVARAAAPELAAWVTRQLASKIPLDVREFVRAIGRIGTTDPIALAALRASMSVTAGWASYLIHGLAAEAAGAIGPDAVSLRPAVAALLASPQAAVRTSALEALVRIDGTMQRVRPAILKELALQGRYYLLNRLARLGPLAAAILPDLEALRPTARRYMQRRIDEAIQKIRGDASPGR